MNRQSWASGKVVKRLTKEEELAKDEAWCHAACLHIAEGLHGWEKVADVSPAIKAVKELRRKYEALVKDNKKPKGTSSARVVRTIGVKGQSWESNWFDNVTK